MSDESDTLTQIRELFEENPFIRGTLTYAITWPACSLIQEYVEYGTSLARADWAKAARFCLFGAVFMSPLYYSWLKFTEPYFQEQDIMTAITRAAVEQVTYGPFSLVYFFFIMSLLEMQPVESCVNEVKEKFWPTYKSGLLFWPAAQTINFYFLSEDNRLVFRCIVGCIWIIYMAHIKSKTVRRRRRRRRSRSR